MLTSKQWFEQDANTANLINQQQSSLPSQNTSIKVKTSQRQ